MAGGGLVGVLFVLFFGIFIVCGGLLLDDASCFGKCGQHLSSSLPCQCNSHCQSFGDCCPDYQALCVGNSCAGKCGQDYNPKLPCQCNSNCPSHNNCCPDYNDVCLGSRCNSSFTDVTEALWRNDVNRLDVNMYTMNFQHHVDSSSNSDLSPAPFFSRVDQAALNARPTFQKFLALQDNYQPAAGQSDAPSSGESAEVEAFLDAVLQTPVMHILLEYLQCRKIVTTQQDLRTQLKKLWFQSYPRHPGGTSDTSGFEHVMVGEYKNSATVNGLHNWLSYFSKEKAHHINYYGYVFRASPNLVGLNFNWNGRHKALGAFFVGTSPEFDLALYSLCALTHNGHTRLDGHDVRVQVYDVSYVSGLQIASAYPTS